MIAVVAALAVVCLGALITALIISNAAIAWACAGVCAIALVLLLIDAIRERQAGDVSSGEQPLEIEHRHTAGDELFGEHEVERELAREETRLDPDMVGYDVPHAEAIENIHHASQGPTKQ